MPDKDMKFNWFQKKKRFLFGVLSDCGDLIERRFPDQIEYLVPVYDRKFNTSMKWYDRFLPRKWRHERFDGPYAKAGMKHNDYDIYLWDNYIFAVHCRLYWRSNILKGEYVVPTEAIRKFIASIFTGYKSL
jgi:hypothetical protein